ADHALARSLLHTLDTGDQALVPRMHQERQPLRLDPVVDRLPDLVIAPHQRVELQFVQPGSDRPGVELSRLWRSPGPNRVGYLARKLQGLPVHPLRVASNRSAEILQ